MLEKYSAFLVFTAISGFFIYGLGMTGLEAQKNRQAWPKYDAIIEKTEIVAGPANEDGGRYGLILFLSTKKQGRTLKFRRQKTSGKENQMKKLRDETYPTGGTVPIFINPQNEQEFLFEVSHSWGPYLTGFLPGVIFFLIGLSTLRRTKTRPNSIQNISENRSE